MSSRTKSRDKVLLSLLAATAGVVGVAPLLLPSQAEASAITAWTHPTSPGAQVTLTRSGGLDIVSTPTDLWGNWASDTRAFSPFMRKGETLYAQIDSGTTHFRNSFIIDTAGLSGINYPADAFLTPDTNKAYSLSIHEVPNPFGVPDTEIRAYLWAGRQPSKVESTRVGRGLNSTTYHGVFLGLQSDSTVRTDDWMHYLLELKRDTIFRRRDSFRVDRAFDGNARLIDTVHLDTILPRFLDVQSLQLLAPTQVDSGANFNLEAVIRNNGTDPASGSVLFKRGSVILDTQPYTSLYPGITDTIVSNLIQAIFPRGSNPLVDTVGLTGDSIPSNNKSTADVFVVVRDASVIGVSPARAYIVPPDSQATVTRQATLYGSGNVQTIINIESRILDSLGNPISTDTVKNVSLNQNETRPVSFPATRLFRGVYTLESRIITLDMYPQNDTLSGMLSVDLQPPVVGWREKAPMPPGLSGKDVKAGGSLVAFQEGDNSDGIYALKGNKTNEFWKFDPVREIWIPMANLPEGLKQVKAGGSLTSDGKSIFALKGNNTTEFYRFSLDSSLWVPLTSVPLGTSGKKVKGGSDMGIIGDTLYLIKGNTNELLPFNLINGNWGAGLPLVPGPYKCKDGSDVVAAVNEGRQGLFTLQGKSPGNFFWYDAGLKTWTAKQSIPTTDRMGKYKKPGDGAGLAFDGDNLIYAFKGNNTQGLWMYNIGINSWTELDTIPAYGSTGKRKKVKAGGDLAFWQNGSNPQLYGIKGNKSREFWMYGIPLAGIPPSTNEAREEIQSGVLYHPPEQTVPTILTRGQLDRLPQQGILYDGSGKQVNTNQVHDGVYFLRTNNSPTTKVIVTK